MPVQLAQNPITNSNSKHIGVRHHFFRELVCQRDIKAVQVPSEFQHAGILTTGFSICFVCVPQKVPNEFEVIFLFKDW